MPLGAFISPGNDLDRTLDRVALADQLGFKSVYTTHIAGRDSLAVLMAYASRTERARLGTGVLPILSRTPVATAQAAATIDEFSGGRMVLGMGVSHRAMIESWFGAELPKPVTQMREYAAVVRAILKGEDPPKGEFFSSQFHFMGYPPRPDLPIYIAGLSPNMLKLAATDGDGVMLWLCSPSYIKDVVVPEVTAAREAAGLSMEGYDIVAAVPVALTEDPEGTRANLRQDLVIYMSLPFYRAMLERSGFAEEITAFDAGMADGDVERAKAAISDRMLGELAGIGTSDDVTGAVQRYRDAGAVSPCVGGIPGTDFDASLNAAAGLL